MNQIERYLAAAAGKDEVHAGDDITVKVDLAIAHDITGPMAVEQFKKIGISQVFDNQKVVFVLDHIIPAATVEAKVLHNVLREFSREYGVKLYDKGEGVIHQVIAEKHPLKRGSILIGADSHTCTAGAYRVLAIPVGATELAATMATGTLDLEVPEVCEICIEGQLQPGVYAKDVILHLIGYFGTAGFTDQGVIYTGSLMEHLTMDDKMTISNMGIEMGSMISYFSDPAQPVGTVKEVYTFQAEDIPASVACPPNPGIVVKAEDLSATKISQVVIGSCTNGRLSDMLAAAEVLKGRKVAEGVTLLIIPASVDIAQQMEDQGLNRIFREAGGMITSPGCGPCFGAHMGLLAAGDVAVSTTNRNFPGRMGHREGKVYLASPRLAAESAVAGTIVPPGSVVPLGGLANELEF
ncbi:3-isopropylmalate dehydratase large subunit [Desulfosporosinus orientis DSM 765]|uniref:3-isopropylmalate dehydratase large subunit n=1 Tax=Desulfosporosinus orientis (strain ATCC 19365 / DSM 765 / NCIMB 8382 / VKM B-1628 / Singapore I) TaxID=768706 RepID=G7W7U2_DESOD|nr:aconitase/3-isopropylmalate dehydratase large subunit family protein [Desulfosporosinus orientis]AET66157.1 3-isopropylmalate dehydratase large subunit [Desulfosporosinus orientis DSM 765]